MSPRLIVICQLAVATLFSGCASFNRIADHPAPLTGHSVQVTAKPLSKMNELPIGAYYDKERQIVVAGHQKGLGVGMLFGVVGVLVADSTNRSSAEKRFGDATGSSSSDLVSLTQAALERVIAEHPEANWNTNSGSVANPLILSPHAIFTVRESGTARLFASVRAEIPGPDGKPRWLTRYFARAPGEYTIEGEDGWMTDTRFAEGMSVALEQAIEACLADSRGELKGTRTVQAKGVFPFLNTEKFKLPFIVVREDAHTWIAKLAAGDVMVMSGTHVLDPDDYEIEDAKFKDPRK